MLDHAVDDYLAGEIAHHLMNCDNDSARAIGSEADRIHMRIDHAPLPRPVGADALVSMDNSTFHAVGPDDVRFHAGERRWNIAGVEGCVGSLEQFGVDVQARHRNVQLIENWRIDRRKTQSLHAELSRGSLCPLW